MKRISRSIVFAMALALSVTSVAMTARAAHRRAEYLKIYGTVLSIDRQASTMLVSDLWSHKLYLVKVPAGATFKITFGLNLRLDRAELWQTNKNDRVLLGCTRTGDDRLVRLDENRQAEVLVAIR